MEDVLHSQFREFINSLIHMLSYRTDAVSQEASGDLITVGLALDQVSPSEIMETVRKDILPHKQQIAKKDTNFFLKHRELFDALPSDKVDCFANLIKRDILTADEIDVVFAYFSNFIACAETHTQRKKNI